MKLPGPGFVRASVGVWPCIVVYPMICQFRQALSAWLVYIKILPRRSTTNDDDDWELVWLWVWVSQEKHNEADKLERGKRRQTARLFWLCTFWRMQVVLLKKKRERRTQPDKVANRRKCVTFTLMSNQKGWRASVGTSNQTTVDLTRASSSLRPNGILFA